MKTLITHHKNLNDLGKEKNRLQGLKLWSVLLILVFALSSMTSFAQKKKFRKMDKSEIQKRKAEGRTVKGNVSFKNEGIAGASIYLKGTQMGDNTNYKNIIVSAVIGKDFLDLVISDLIQKSNLVIEKDIRHSSHIIPSSEDVSYNNKSGDFWEIYSVDIRNLMTKKIADINGK